MDASQLHTVGDYVGAAVAIASILSNFVKPWTIVGRILHFVAINWRTGSLTGPQPPMPGGGA